VKHAFLHSLVDGRNSLWQQLIDLGFVAGGQNAPKVPNRRSQLTAISPIDLAPFLILAHPLFCRLMVRHATLQLSYFTKLSKFRTNVVSVIDASDGVYGPTLA